MTTRPNKAPVRIAGRVSNHYRSTHPERYFGRDPLIEWAPAKKRDHVLAGLGAAVGMLVMALAVVGFMVVTR